MLAWITACASLNFPGGSQWRVKALQAIGGPFPQVLLPDRRYLAGQLPQLPALKAYCASAARLVPADALESGDYARITELARAAVARLPDLHRSGGGRQRRLLRWLNRCLR